MESDIGNARNEKEQIGEDNSRASILVTSFRKFDCDVDGISAKAIIDGIVHCEILPDDGPRYVARISYEQVKVKNISEEKTEIEIKWGEK